MTLLADIPAAPHVPEATWEGTLTPIGGELLIGGEAGAQLAELYDEDAPKVYERVKFFDPAGDEVMCPIQSADGKLSVSAQMSEGAAAGDVYTLKAKVADTAGELHELSHDYVVGQGEKEEGISAEGAAAGQPAPPLPLSRNFT